MDQALLSLDNPVFRAYALSASILVLKMMSMSWLTVYRMMKVKSGYRSPEDARPGWLNPEGSASATEVNEYVERTRRIHQNDVENIPPFLVAGLLFVFTEPALWVAQVLYYGYAGSRLLHFAAYVSGQSHEVRSTIWTPGSLAVMGMALFTLYTAWLA